MSKHNGGGTAEQTAQVREVVRLVDTARAAQRSQGTDARGKAKASRSRGRKRAEVVTKSPTVVGPTSEKPPTLSPGVKLTRVYKGRKIVVTVMEGGRYEWNGKFFTSLSAVANEITGSHVSGNAFFGLRPRAKKETPR